MLLVIWGAFYRRNSSSRFSSLKELHFHVRQSSLQAFMLARCPVSLPLFLAVSLFTAKCCALCIGWKAKSLVMVNDIPQPVCSTGICAFPFFFSQSAKLGSFRWLVVWASHCCGTKQIISFYITPSLPAEEIAVIKTKNPNIMQLQYTKNIIHTRTSNAILPSLYSHEGNRIVSCRNHVVVDVLLSSPCRHSATSHSAVFRLKLIRQTHVRHGAKTTLHGVIASLNWTSETNWHFSQGKCRWHY